MKLSDARKKIMDKLSVRRTDNKNAELEKVHIKPKTERRCERVRDALDLYHVMRKHGDKLAFTYLEANGKAKDVTYTEFCKMIHRVAAGITKEGCAGKRLAIIGETSVKWYISYFAVLLTGGVVIPMDRELEIGVIEDFLDSVDADGIFYSGHFNGKFASTMQSHRTMKHFFPFAPDEAELAMGATKSFDSVLENGELELRHGYHLPKVINRDALAELLFTSGTTGSSKCVMLSQRNIFSVVTSAVESVDFYPEDTVVSVLPVHHTYELAINLAELDYGAHICINDSLTHVLKNFQRFQPTGLTLVPLFVYTMYKKIWAEAKKTGRDKKLKMGIVASNALLKMGIDRRKELFADIHASFGGRLEKIICGGAALNPKMIAFFESIGISIYEGFGITECAPLTFVTPYYARKYGSVGPAVPCCQGRIEGTVRNSRGYIEGEIQIKGDNVMLGYYNNPEANENAFTEDGWFRTGDMGYMDSDGYFYITGRLKTVIVLENGKNIFPEEIEEYIDDIETVAEVVVVGRQSGEAVSLVALVYPDYTKFGDNVSADEIQKSIENSIYQMNKKLPSYKQVKKVELRDHEFEKTTSKKIKRHLVK